MEDTSRPAILCVDDEPHVLSSLSLLLRRHYEVLTAGSGMAGLETLAARPDVAVIVSDMRMPGMDGAAFLSEARQRLPDAPRLLLTGYADIDAAIVAVNDGHIFRFLLKPCPPATLLSALASAVEQHRLVTAERVLLEQTLKGALKALSDVLALASPAAFGHATRIKQLAAELAQRLMPAQRWAVEVAAMLAPLGSIALPVDVAEKLAAGRLLTGEEQCMVERIPALTESLLASIPRLELVRAMLALSAGAPAPALPSGHRALAVRGAALLRMALDFDALDAAGNPADVAVATLRGRGGRYDAEALAALDALRGGSAARAIREIPASAMRAGMVIAADIRLASGALLVARGFEVTQGLVERIRNLRPGALAGPVRIYTGSGTTPIRRP